MGDDYADEWAAQALLAADEELAWQRSRNLDLGLEPGCVTTDAMQARWATDRAAVEAECPDGYEWRRMSLEAVAEKAAVLQTLREGNQP